MSWRWRKSIGRGPFRINLTKRGIGYSIGIPGLRYGRSPDGRRYVSQGIPGTGLYRIKYFGRGKPAPPGTPPIIGPASSPQLPRVAWTPAGRSVVGAARSAMRVLWVRTLAISRAVWRLVRGLGRRTADLTDYIRTRARAGWSYSPPPIKSPSVSATTAPAPAAQLPSAPVPPTNAPPAAAPSPPPASQQPWWRQKLGP